MKMKTIKILLLTFLLFSCGGKKYKYEIKGLNGFLPPQKSPIYEGRKFKPTPKNRQLPYGLPNPLL